MSFATDFARHAEIFSANCSPRALGSVDEYISLCSLVNRKKLRVIGSGASGMVFEVRDGVQGNKTVVKLCFSTGSLLCLEGFLGSFITSMYSGGHRQSPSLVRSSSGAFSGYGSASCAGYLIRILKVASLGNQQSLQVVKSILNDFYHISGGLDLRTSKAYRKQLVKEKEAIEEALERDEDGCIGLISMEMADATGFEFIHNQPSPEDLVREIRCMMLQVLFALMDMKNSCLASHGDVRLPNLLVFMRRSEETSSLSFRSPDGDGSWYGFSRLGATTTPTFVLADFDNSSIGSREALEYMKYERKGQWSDLENRNLGTGLACDFHTLGCATLCEISGWIGDYLRSGRVISPKTEAEIMDLFSFCIDELAFDEANTKHCWSSVTSVSGYDVDFRAFLRGYKAKIRAAQTLLQKADAVKVSYGGMGAQVEPTKFVRPTGEWDDRTKLLRRTAISDFCFVPDAAIVRGKEEETTPFWRHRFFEPLAGRPPKEDGGTKRKRGDDGPVENGFAKKNRVEIE
jgi:hypothetical protein